MSFRAGFAAAAAVAILALPAAALAGPGKAGLWQITTTMSGMDKMIPPAALAQMKAHGITMPAARTFTTQQCVTPEQAAANGPPPMRGNDCHMANMHTTGNSFSGDLVCSGRTNGSGHIQVVYDSSEHYRGDMTMHATAEGRSTNMSNHFEGRWLKADCTGAQTGGMGMMRSGGGMMRR
jgi:hypothetical protein